jgi:hypothetical protein
LENLARFFIENVSWTKPNPTQCKYHKQQQMVNRKQNFSVNSVSAHSKCYRKTKKVCVRARERARERERERELRPSL